MKDSFLNTVATMEHTAAIVILVERPQSICYLEAENDVTHLLLENDTRFTINARLSELMTLLPNDHFFQCGENYTVNALKVLEFWVSSEPILVMSCGHIVPVPKPEVLKVRKYLKKNKGEEFIKRPSKVSAY
jgi:hypothetical protein